MKHQVHVTATPKDPPDLDQFVATLLALAVTRLNERKEAEGTSASEEDKRD